MLQLSHISVYVIIILLFNFPIIFFNIYSFFKKYLHFLQHFYIPYFFISPLPSTIISPFIFLFIFLFFFCSFLFTTFYYKFITLFHSLHTFPSQTKKKGFSLSRSLNFVVDFFYFSFIFALG